MMELDLKGIIILGVLSLAAILGLSLAYNFFFYPWLAVNIQDQFVHSIVSGLILIAVTVMFIPPYLLVWLAGDVIPSEGIGSLIRVIFGAGIITLFFYAYYHCFTVGLNKSIIFSLLGGAISSGAIIYITWAISEYETKHIIIGSVAMVLTLLFFFVFYFWWWVSLIVLGLAAVGAPTTKYVLVEVD